MNFCNSIFDYDDLIYNYDDPIFYVIKREIFGSIRKVFNSLNDEEKYIVKSILLDKEFCFNMNINKKQIIEFNKILNDMRYKFKML